MLPVPLPPHLVAAAREYADGTRTPTEPRNAATVALLRPGTLGPQVYLLRRQTSMAFAAGMCVFPGGGVDERDFATDVAWTGPSVREWADRLAVDEATAGALVCAAVRETFEESGVLLAGPRPDAVVMDTTAEDWEVDRAALESRELSLTELLDRRGLVLRADLLGAWAAWTTPVFEPRRFRTWFFVAELPQGQRTRDVSRESDRVEWLGARDAVTAVDSGELFMMPPTYLTCLELAEHAGPDEVLAACHDRPIEMFTPELLDQEPPAMSVPAGLESLLASHHPSRRR